MPITSTPQPDIQPEVFEIDSNINRLVRRFELLVYVNPLNIAQEQKAFFNAKFNINPQFKYRKTGFDTFKLVRLLYSNRVDKLKDNVLRSFYENLIYEYSGLIRCIDAIGQPNKQFYYNSLRFFNTPPEKMVQNANFILHFENEALTGSMYEKNIPTEKAIESFKTYGSQYGFDFKVKASGSISAAAMVVNKDRSLLLKKNHRFSEHELQVLFHHEIGIHLVTTFNALNQPLYIFKNGFPGNVETQEGLAVFSEYLSGNLTLERLKELAYRVIAVDTLAKGFNFKETFDLLYSQYRLPKEKAFTICLRVHRGGGFTKDALYLSGLKQVYNLYKNNQSLDNMLMGKCSLSYAEEIAYMQQLGLCNMPKYLPISFSGNKNQDEKLAFILNNLK
ncbi:MAG: DUF1704 domain-containing protein [Flavobacteriaceae bacterium]|nr:DUF1704 domain-containing protein [Flavobacteriaceae bacterium]